MVYSALNTVGTQGNSIFYFVNITAQYAVKLGLFFYYKVLKQHSFTVYVAQCMTSFASRELRSPPWTVHTGGYFVVNPVTKACERKHNLPFHTSNASRNGAKVTSTRPYQ